MEQKFVHGDKAAQIIGMSYKTLKKRYDEGWINGERTPQGKLKFTLEEVEQAKLAWEQERSQYASSTDLNLPDPTRTFLEEEIAELKKEVALLKERVANLERVERIPLYEFPQEDFAPQVTHTVSASPSKDPLPEGCILASEFAYRYSVKRETFRDHYKIGLGRGAKEKALVSSRPKPGRGHETEYYLTEEQQQSVLDYWLRHDIPYTRREDSEKEK